MNFFKRRDTNLNTQFFRCKTKMCLKNLPQVHTGKNGNWRNNDINWRPISKIWHISNGKNSRNNTLVSMSAGQFVSNGNMAELRNLNNNLSHCARLQFVTLLAVQNLNA